MTAPKRPKMPPVTAVPEPGASVYDRRTSQRGASGRAVPEPFDPATVRFDPGVYLVEASAGTGKTFSLTLTVLRMLLDRDAAGAYRVRGIGNILVVTFTNAATSELVTRVRAALREAVDVFAGTAAPTEQNAHLFALREQYGADGVARLRDALASIDELAIFTIHGFCKRVLDESALESGTSYDAGFIENDDLWLERVTQDWWRRTVYENPTLAALVVAEEWVHNAFVRDLKQWRRWPRTRLDPDESLDAALAAFERAQREFAQVWDREHVAAFLAAQPWYSKVPLDSPQERERVLAAGDALAGGSLLGISALHLCTTTALTTEKKGIQKSAPDNVAQAKREPFALACDGVVTAVDRVYRALRVSSLRNVAHQFEAEKERRHLLDFDDLLRRLRRALEHEGADGLLARAIRDRYDAALIDEFQDTDPYQFPIFSTAFAGRPLFLIGDPKQAIYAFRGADIFAYRQAALAADRTFTLGRNWRSTPRMVNAVNALFGHRPDSFLYDWIDFHPAVAARSCEDPLEGDGKGALHWWYAPPDTGAKGAAKALSKKAAVQRFHEALARECVRLMTPCKEGGAGIAPGSIAVLVRDSYEAADVQRALRSARVPSIVARLGDVLESLEVKELERILAAVLKPQDGRVVRAALATEVWGKSASEIHALSRQENERDWQGLVESLTAMRETWIHRGFLRMIQTFIAEQHVAERLLAHEDGERRLTNLRQAVELFHTLSVEERLSPEGLILRIARARAMKTEESERTELRLESDADAVQIVTIHKSKGLEYDVVFCPGLWACKRTGADAPVLVHEDEHTVVFDHGSSDRAERGRLAEAERLAEDLRLVYVALTRARYRCYVGWGGVKNSKSGDAAWHTALAYLLRPDGITGTASDVAERVATAMESGMAGWNDALRALVEASGGTMSLEVLDGAAAPVAPWRGVAPSLSEPTPRRELPSATQLDTWRIASFTSLTASHHGAAHVEDGRDVSDPARERGALVGALRPVHGRDDFLAFPAGRVAGIVLHELFERIDFGATDEDIRALAIEILARERFIENEHDGRVTAVTTMARRVLDARLPGAHFALRDLPRDVTLREWAFDLPLGTVERDTLARIFADDGGELARRYAPALRRIGADRTHGFLTGVIDLAFVREGRWYVVDWKSNHLGDEPVQYEPAALEHEMFASHYVLQYHLYVTALHRYLRLRQPGYDYDAHMGGVWYSFLRGVDGSERGWFADRPPRALIQALSALMDAQHTTAQERVA